MEIITIIIYKKVELYYEWREKVEEHTAILNHIISITESRDIEILEMSMLRTIFELVPCRMVYFIKTHVEEMTINAVTGYDADGYSGLIDKSIFDNVYRLKETMILAVSDHKATSVDSFSHPFTICPVDILSRNIGFIALDRPETSTQDLYILESIIRIYQNYVSLLIDNQRDTLTGLLNRKTFDDRIMKLIELRKKANSGDEEVDNERRSIHAGKRFWLGMFDIDDFKRINDTFGHIYGDEILILIGRLMHDAFRGTDLKFRFGGEEFVGVIESENYESALSVFERFRENVENYKFPQTGKITVSIGVVEITGKDTPSVFVGCADRALYYAKEHGKNKTFFYEELLKKGLVKPEKTKTGDIIFFNE